MRLGLGILLAVLPLATASAAVSTINSNFNGTAIPSPRVVWFNAHLTSVSGVSGPVTISARNQTVTFESGGTTYTVRIPDAQVRILAGSTPSTVFEVGASTWITTVPSASGTPFLAGRGWHVPASGLSGGANPVSWSADFYSNPPGAAISWQWGAAVYTQFTDDPASIGATPVDGFVSGASQSGTPYNFRSFVVGGARGGGGSNFTGSNSGTASVSGLQVPPTCDADINGDGVKTVEDIFAFLAAYFAGNLKADLNHDGIISVADFLKEFLPKYFDPAC